ncbi:hypothetical protein EIN_277370, partial [Entamoeba invadens IP1]
KHDVTKPIQLPSLNKVTTTLKEGEVLNTTRRGEELHPTKQKIKFGSPIVIGSKDIETHKKPLKRPLKKSKKKTKKICMEEEYSDDESELQNEQLYNKRDHFCFNETMKRNNELQNEGIDLTMAAQYKKAYNFLKDLLLKMGFKITQNEAINLAYKTILCFIRFGDLVERYDVTELNVFPSDVFKKKVVIPFFQWKEIPNDIKTNLAFYKRVSTFLENAKNGMVELPQKLERWYMFNRWSFCDDLRLLFEIEKCGVGAYAMYIENPIIRLTLAVAYRFLNDEQMAGFCARRVEELMKII